MKKFYLVTALTLTTTIAGIDGRAADLSHTYKAGRNPTEELTTNSKALGLDKREIREEAHIEHFAWHIKKMLGDAGVQMKLKAEEIATILIDLVKNKKLDIENLKQMLSLHFGATDLELQNIKHGDYDFHSTLAAILYERDVDQRKALGSYGNP